MKTRSALSTVYQFAGRYTEAEAEAKAGAELFPETVGLLIHLADAQRRQGRHDEAAAIYARASQHPDFRVLATARLAAMHARAGRREEALRLLEEVRPSLDADHSYDAAVVYAALGDADRAFALLEQNFAAHSTRLRELKVDPDFEPLRPDPRFAEMVRRVGLE